MPGSAWQLQLFDTPQLVHPELPALALSRKDAALLALVALAGPLPTARAAGLIWPQASASGAVNNLRQRLHRLRRGTAARLVEAADAMVLASDLAGLLLPTRDALADDPGAWDGDLLGAHDYDDHPDFAAWLHQQRDAWRHRRAAALASLAYDAERQAEWPRALRLAQRLLQDDPLVELAHRRLMRLHYLRGDRAAAVAAFERCERRLKDELSLQPSAETLALLAQVERLAPVSLPARLVPPALSRPPRMAGRDAELATVSWAWSSGRVVLLLGEAGLGKTRLLEEWQAVQPAQVGARARPGDSAVPWALLTRLLRGLLGRHAAALPEAQRGVLARLLPELGPAAPGEGDAQRVLLLRAIEQWLVAARGHGLGGLVVDDLHFADAASLEGLHALVDAEALPGLPWVLALRPDGLAAESPPALRPLWEVTGLVHLPLHPLGLVALESLLVSLDLPDVDPRALAPALLQRTGGNPLFVLETLRDLLVRGGDPRDGRALGLPETVERLIERRLQALSADALALARAAAVAGDDFSVALAESVLGASALRLADAWRELEAAQLLREQRFAHDLAQEAALRTLPDAIARVVHRQVAAFLARQGPDPARLAWHWQRAGEPARAGPLYLLAAEAARRIGRREDEAALLDQAVACFGAAGVADAVFDARCARANAWVQSRGLAFARGEIDQLVDEADGPVQQLAAWRVQAQALLFARDAAAAWPVTQVFLAAARLSGDEEARALAAGYGAQALTMLGRLDEAQPLLEEMGAASSRRGDGALRFRYHAMSSFLHHHRGRLVQATRSAQQAYELALQAGDLAGQHESMSNLAAMQLGVGQGAEALAAVRRTVGLSQALDLPLLQRAIDSLNLGMASLAVGHYAAAVEALEACAEQPDAPPALREHARTLLAVAWTHLAQPARVRRLLSGDPEGLSLTPPSRALRLLLRHGGMLQAEAADPLALPALCAAAEPLGGGVVWGMARLADARRQGPAALIGLAAAMAEAHDAELPPLALLARVAWVEALVDTDRRALALVEAERALHSLQGMSLLVVYKPQLWWQLHRAMRQVDAPALAARALAGGLEWLSGEVLPALPAAWRPAFVERNPVNRALLAMARANLPT